MSAHCYKKVAPPLSVDPQTDPRTFSYAEAVRRNGDHWALYVPMPVSNWMVQEKTQDFRDHIKMMLMEKGLLPRCQP